MNQQRHTPLDAEERALADALAGLPAVEPSPELDARILAHAARVHAAGNTAGSTSRRPRRHRWWLGTGLGTAAAAVLAAGVAWQIGLFDIHLGSDVPVPLPQAPLAEPAVMSDTVSVDLKHQSRRAAASTEEAARKTESEPAPAAPVQRSAPPPAPPAPPAPAPAPPPPTTPAPVETRPATARAIPGDAITTSAGAQAVREIALPPWQQDAHLPPDLWLQRIRERLQHGDQSDARTSLAAFRERHPDIVLPADLAALGGQ